MNGQSGGKRILVVGAAGQVGTQVLRNLPEGSALPTSRHAKQGWVKLDLATVTQAEAQEVLQRFEVETIYCVGGMTNVDECESTAELARRVNCEGPAILAAAAAERGARFVYFSTDYVFDGRSGPYAEEDPGNPICAYGRSKWLGELAVLDAHPSPLVIRTTVVYGPDSNRRNFLYALRSRLTEGKEFRVPDDQISTPTYNADLAFAAVSLADRAVTGTFHVAGPDVVTRLEFGRRAAAVMGLDPAYLTGVSTAELAQVAPRPLRAGLLTRKLITTMPEICMRGIEQGISAWMRTSE
jgi:dTDP-4-dehydrorhamnose reductase